MKTPSITRYLAPLRPGMPDDPLTAHGPTWQQKMDIFLAPKTRRRRPPPPSRPPTSSSPSGPDVVVLEDDIEDDEDEEEERRRRRERQESRTSRAALKVEEYREEDDEEDLFRLPRPQSTSAFPSSLQTTVFPSAVAPPSDLLSSSQSSALTSSQSALSPTAFGRLKAEDDEDAPFRLFPLSHRRSAAPPPQHPQSGLTAAREASSPSLFRPLPPFIKEEETDEEESFHLAPAPRPLPLPVHPCSPPSVPLPLRPPAAAPLHSVAASAVHSVPTVKVEPGTAQSKAQGKENQLPLPVTSPAFVSPSKPSSSSPSPAVAPPMSSFASSPPPLEVPTQPPPSSRRRRSPSLSSISSSDSSDEQPVRPKRKVVKREPLTASASKRQRPSLPPARDADEQRQPAVRSAPSPPPSRNPSSFRAASGMASAHLRAPSLFAVPPQSILSAPLPSFLLPQATAPPSIAPAPSFDETDVSEDPFAADPASSAPVEGGYSFKRLSELRGTSAINYDQHFSARPPQMPSARDGPEGEEGEDSGTAATQTPAVDRERVLGYWRVRNGRKVFITPKGQVLDGFRAYTTAQRLKKTAVEKGLIAAPKERKRKKASGDSQEGGEAKKKRRVKGSRKRSSSREAKSSDDERPQLQPKVGTARKSKKKRSGAGEAKKKSRKESRASTQPSTVPRTRPAQVSSDEEAEWNPGTAQDIAESDDDSGESSDDEEELRNFIADDDDSIEQYDI